VKITWFKGGKSVAEIYQQVQIQFAFLSSTKDGDRQCHDFIKCRDFLHDAVKAHLNKNNWEIYGFEYKHGINPPISMETMNMLVRRQSKNKEHVSEFRKMMDYSLKLIHHYEKMMGVQKSEITDTKDANGNPVSIFVGDPMWVSSPFLVSAYTYLIRMGYKKLEFKSNDELIAGYKELLKIKEVDNDLIYLKDIWNKLDVVLRNTKKLFFTNEKIDPIFFDKKVNTNQFHNNCGIQSLCRFISPRQEYHDFITKEMKKLKRT